MNPTTEPKVEAGILIVERHMRATVANIDQAPITTGRNGRSARVYAVNGLWRHDDENGWRLPFRITLGVQDLLKSGDLGKPYVRSMYAAEVGQASAELRALIQAMRPADISILTA